MPFFLFIYIVPDYHLVRSCGVKLPNTWFHKKQILHVSEVDVRETNMMGSSPIIILAFQTQQVYCVRGRQCSIKDKSQVIVSLWLISYIDSLCSFITFVYIG